MQLSVDNISGCNAISVLPKVGVLDVVLTGRNMNPPEFLNRRELGTALFGIAFWLSVQFDGALETEPVIQVKPTGSNRNVNREPNKIGCKRFVEVKGQQGHCITFIGVNAYAIF